MATADARDYLREWDEGLAEARRAADAARHYSTGPPRPPGRRGSTRRWRAGTLAAAREHARQVRDRARDAAEAGRAAEAARAEVARARQALAPDPRPRGRRARPDLDLDAVQAWAEDVLRARAALDEVEARLAVVASDLEGLGPVPDVAEAEALGRAAAPLEGAAVAGAGARWPAWRLGLGGHPDGGRRRARGAGEPLVDRPFRLGGRAAGRAAGGAPAPYGGAAAAQARWPGGVDAPASWDTADVAATLDQLPGAPGRRRPGADPRGRPLAPHPRALPGTTPSSKSSPPGGTTRRRHRRRPAARPPAPRRPPPPPRRVARCGRGRRRRGGRGRPTPTPGSPRPPPPSPPRSVASVGGGVPVNEAEARLDALDTQSQALRAARRDEALTPAGASTSRRPGPPASRPGSRRSSTPPGSGTWAPTSPGPPLDELAGQRPGVGGRARGGRAPRPPRRRA